MELDGFVRSCRAPDAKLVVITPVVSSGKAPAQERSSFPTERKNALAEHILTNQASLARSSQER